MTMRIIIITSTIILMTLYCLWQVGLRSKQMKREESLKSVHSEMMGKESDRTGGYGGGPQIKEVGK